MVVVLQVLCHYEFMIEMGPLISENQVKKSMSCVASPHLTRLGKGCYTYTRTWLLWKSFLSYTYVLDIRAYMSYCWRILEMIYIGAYPSFLWMMYLETFLYWSIVTSERALIKDAIVYLLLGHSYLTVLVH